MLGALFGKPAQDNSGMKDMVIATEQGHFEKLKGLTGGYAKVLDKALNMPGRVLAGAFVVLVGVMVLYGAVGKGVEFFPEIEPELATVLIHARGNLSVFEQDQLVREVENRVIDLNNDIKGIEVLYTRSGKPVQQGSDLAEDVIGQLQMQFRDWDQRPPADEILTKIRDVTRDIPGLRVETRKMEEGPPTGKAVQIQIGSRLPETLDDATEAVLGALQEIGDFRDVEDTRPMPGIKWELDVDRAQARKFGLDITQVGYYIRMVTNGLEVAEYRPDDSDDEIDIVIRHEKESRTLDQLDRVRIETGEGSVPVSSFVTRTPKQATGVINRSDQRRIITVKADLPPGVNTNEKVEQIKTWLLANRDKFDPSIELTFKGEDEQQRESEEFLKEAFTVALFMIAIILLAQFNSFYSAGLILSAILMSTIGVMLGLIITQQPFGIIMSGIGVIALAGIIVNNNIVLIDTFDYLKRKHGGELSGKEIIMRTGVQRLRPVLLTTLTTVIGLMPMVCQTNIDFITREVSIGAPSTQWWVQLSSAIAFGLTFSTVLTLVVTPSALMLRENFKSWRTSGNKGEAKKKLSGLLTLFRS
ncbi:MAG: efflux RND transporter permease subunit [Alphaproteobacteria bacterium]|nr:efflux RND transporter permease subunit [Alphaproteobacteria bacterium]